MYPFAQQYELVIEQRPDYLKVTLRAEQLTLDAAQEYFRRVGEAAEKAGCTRIMIERDVPKTLDYTDYVLSADAFISGLLRKRVAFVNRHPAIHEDLRFAIMTSNNRGANYGLFDTIEAAEEWLCE